MGGLRHVLGNVADMHQYRTVLRLLQHLFERSGVSRGRTQHESGARRSVSGGEVSMLEFCFGPPSFVYFQVLVVLCYRRRPRNELNFKINY